MSSIDAYNKQATGATLLVKPLRIARELAQASVVVIAFAVAILVVGTPIALAVRALHDVVLWLTRIL